MNVNESRCHHEAFGIYLLLGRAVELAYGFDSSSGYTYVCFVPRIPCAVDYLPAQNRQIVLQLQSLFGTIIGRVGTRSAFPLCAIATEGMRLDASAELHVQFQINLLLLR